MFSDLPSIFDRNFVTGFFLPMVFFIAASFGLFHVFGLPIQLSNDPSAFQATTLIGVGSLLGGIILLVLNNEIYRTVEGYPVNSVKLFKAVELRRYRRLMREKEALQEERELYQTGEEMPLKSADRRMKLLGLVAERFPDQEVYVLPTSFGNIVRAFEVYSRVIYGIDAVPGWPRLQAVMPKDYHEIINEAKAKTDFWVNMLALSFVFLIEYIVVALYMGRMTKLWIPVLALGFAALFYVRAKYAAYNWGLTVKAAFDVFLPDLRKKLELPFPENMDAERKQWREFSQVTIYHWEKIKLNRVQTSGANSGDEQGS